MKRILLPLSVFALLLAACGVIPASAPQDERVAPADYGGGYTESLALEMEAPIEPMPSESFGDGFGSSTSGTVERLVIKNASISIVVSDPADTLDEIITLAEGMGGFVVTSNLWQTTLSNGATVNQASITIRVPAQKLDEALRQIKSGPGEVRYESISGEDVTSQYTDLQSRLRNLETPKPS